MLGLVKFPTCEDRIFNMLCYFKGTPRLKLFWPGNYSYCAIRISIKPNRCGAQGKQKSSETANYVGRVHIPAQTNSVGILSCRKKTTTCVLLAYLRFSFIDSCHRFINISFSDTTDTEMLKASIGNTTCLLFLPASIQFNLTARADLS